jgi:hypothetical protein
MPPSGLKSGNLADLRIASPLTARCTAVEWAATFGGRQTSRNISRMILCQLAVADIAVAIAAQPMSQRGEERRPFHRLERIAGA